MILIGAMCFPPKVLVLGQIDGLGFQPPELVRNRWVVVPIRPIVWIRWRGPAKGISDVLDGL